MPRSYLPTEAPYLSNEDLPKHRPVHLICGMAAITEYATVEGHVSLLLTALAHGDPVPVAAIYGVLRQGQIQGRALAAVGRAALSDEDCKLLEQLSKVIRKASDARDTLAHRVWFYDSRLSDVIVLADPGIFWRSDHQIKIGGGSGSTTVEHAEKIQAMMRAASHIWTLDDLEQARLSSVHAAVGLVSFRLMVECAEGSSERQLERQKVLNVIQMAL